jgi:nucleoid DNA-binding protein
MFPAWLHISLLETKAKETRSKVIIGDVAESIETNWKSAAMVSVNGFCQFVLRAQAVRLRNPRQ